MAWSSSWIAAAPARSSACTVRTTLRALPKPVSASTITGMRTRPQILASVSATSVMPTRPMSGRPRRVYATLAPERYNASNPAFSAISAVNAS
jgi:hypothetical protein